MRAVKRPRDAPADDCPDFCGFEGPKTAQTLSNYCGFWDLIEAMDQKVCPAIADLGVHGSNVWPGNPRIVFLCLYVPAKTLTRDSGLVGRGFAGFIPASPQDVPRRRDLGGTRLALLPGASSHLHIYHHLFTHLLASLGVTCSCAAKVS